MSTKSAIKLIDIESSKIVKNRFHFFTLPLKFFSQCDIFSSYVSYFLVVVLVLFLVID